MRDSRLISHALFSDVIWRFRVDLSRKYLILIQIPCFAYKLIIFPPYSSSRQLKSRVIDNCSIQPAVENCVCQFEIDCDTPPSLQPLHVTICNWPNQRTLRLQSTRHCAILLILSAPCLLKTRSKLSR
jgi:hypothetical protein